MPNSLPQIDVIPNGVANHYRLRFARLDIEWDLPKDVPPMPVAINWGKLGTDCDLITMTAITFRRGMHTLTIPLAYEFDGASVPRLIRWAPGYQRVGRHLWAALAHDWLIDEQRKPYQERQADLPRVIADAIFVTLLLDTGVSRRQSRLMYTAVRLYSIVRAWWLVDEGGKEIEYSAKEAAKAPEAKSVAVRRAAEEAKAETTVVPCEKDCEP